MIKEAIFHRPKQNWAYAYDGKTVHIRVRTKKNDVERVEAIVGDKYAWDQTKTTVSMHRFSSDELFDYWETAVIPPFRRLRYAFIFHAGEASLVLTEQGFVAKTPDDPNSFFDFPFINPVDIFEPPAWVKDAVFYQIFPERFAKGDPSIDPVNVEPWGGEPTPHNFFGGDLQGVIDHLDHIADLGITAIYFTPLFEATTNHKYDTHDYMKIDPHFGTNEKLKELVEACHARGIKVLLDAVFNHSGRTFPPFVDAQKNGTKSQYADWFHVRQWPLEVIDHVPTYDTFAFEPLMPKLNTENADVKAYLLEVARYWIEEIGIDGWRLDVANEVDHQFWREFRQTVKAVNPDAYILGEIWHDSIAWLQGDQFDAVMNYPFTNAVLDFFAKQTIEADQFIHAIGTQLAAYPQQVTETAFNLLDSHDTPRLLTLCDNNVEAMKLAALFKLTSPGTPCIYYGDEIGLDGGADPGCRKCMEWEPEKQNQDLLEFYKQAIQLRHSHAALRSSDIVFLHAGESNGTLIYERRANNERLLIALNAREQAAKVQVSVASSNELDRAPKHIEFRGFIESEAVAAIDKKQDTSPVQKPLKTPSSWQTLLSSDEQAVGNTLRSNEKGVLSLTLPAYSFYIMKQSLN